jgi:signal transduction histidine kinase
MKRFGSLRWQLLIGTAAWTAGLVFLVNLASLTIIRGRGGMHLHVAAMLLLAVGAMAAGLWQVGRSVSSLNRLRAKLSAMHDGRQERLDGSYPMEVQPLVDDLNTLLEHREQAVARAVAKAGDLAHGLKTPLAVLAQEAARAQAAGHLELAASIDEQVDRMRRQMDYHLAHARAAASGATPGARCHVRASADGLARTLQRLYADRGLAIDVLVAPDHIARTQRQDLDEMLGNLLDNACKWARARVVVTSASRDGNILVAVDDDGPGVEAGMRDQVLRRGVRADETASGSGFGLAIVRELAELYGGAIALDAAPQGGLRAELTLPRVDN